jgi:hypothetical protein
MHEVQPFTPVNPPHRLLMGPGPINADPRVLRAMSSQLIGQYDPVMTRYMNEVMALYRGVFRTENRWTMLVDGTCCRPFVLAIKCWSRCLAASAICCVKLPVAVGPRSMSSKSPGVRCSAPIVLKMRSSASNRVCC